MLNTTIIGQVLKQQVKETQSGDNYLMLTFYSKENRKTIYLNIYKELEVDLLNKTIIAKKCYTKDNVFYTLDKNVDIEIHNQELRRDVEINTTLEEIEVDEVFQKTNYQDKDKKDTYIVTFDENNIMRKIKVKKEPNNFTNVQKTLTNKVVNIKNLNINRINNKTFYSIDNFKCITIKKS